MAPLKSGQMGDVGEWEKNKDKNCNGIVDGDTDSDSEEDEMQAKRDKNCVFESMAYWNLEQGRKKGSKSLAVALA